MAIKTKAQLLTDAATIKNETAQGANTAQRVGTMLENIIDSTLKAKVYRALLTQSGTSAPVAIILENTFDDIPIWSYDDIGSYKLTLTNSFTINKTFFSQPPIQNKDNIIVCEANYSNNEVYLSNYTLGVLSNDFTLLPFEIIVYP